MANLRQSLRQRAGLSDKDMDNDTRRTYARGINNYVEFCQSRGVNKIKDTFGGSGPLTFIQDWERSLESRGLSASTIHTYLAPVCKAYRINMQDVAKPRRKAADVVKGRTVGSRGHTERNSVRYEASVRLAEATGLRRAELLRLTPESFVHDESGALCVRVKGKGGKIQDQRILPQHLDNVLAILKTVNDNSGHLLTPAQMSGHVDYHAIRRECAREAYEYYKNIASTPEGRERLREELIARWNAHHSENPKPDRKGNPRCDETIHSAGLYNSIGTKIWYDSGGFFPNGFTAASKAAQRFLDALDGNYIIRAENRDRAASEGRQTVYDKLALTAVSVFHLAHWRNDVTVRHYML